MTVLIGKTKGVFRDQHGTLYFDLTDLLDRLGMGNSLLDRIRLRTALIAACQEKDLPAVVIERHPAVSRETQQGAA